MAYPVDDNGNIRVDFVWGNMAMQPDEQRGNTYDDNTYTVEGGWATKSLVGNYDLATGWAEVLVRNGDQSDDGQVRYDLVEYGAHDIIDTGYSNYPAFVENYAGDGDSGLEVLVPDLSGAARADMQAILANLGLGFVAEDVFVGATLVNDGKFKAQSPSKGTPVNVESNVGVSFYEAPTVPNVVDFDSVSAAGDALELAGLVLGTVTTSTVGATSGNNNWVKSQSIAAGTKVAAGTAVNLVEYDYVVASTTGPIAGFNRVSAGTSFALNGDQSVMYVAGRTVKPTVGDTISVTGSDDASHNVSWTVAEVENNDSYNTGGTAVKVTLVTGAITSDTATGGTWTKL